MLYLQTLGELTLTAPSGEVLSTRRKELVLLAYLARSAPRAVPRAELAELLWGERVEERARHSLRQALLQLRRVVGEGLRVGNEQVLLVSGTLEVDATAFEAEIAAGRLREAVARWRGDFLAGAEDLGGEVYRGWVEAEREAVRRLLAWALEQLVAEQERAERWEEAVGWAERWVEVLPFDEHPHLRLLEALRRDGRAGEALARHAGFAARLRRELELDPSAELLDFVEELERSVRRELAQLPSPAPAAPSVPEPVGQEEIPAASVGSDARVASVRTEERRLTETPLPRRRRSRRRWAAAVALVALGAAVLWQLREGPEAAPIIAVGVIQDYSGADTTGLAGALPEMLATNLARVPGLRVVSNARVHELLSLLDGAPESGALTRAARQAGASELVEGEIYRRPEGGLRLDLRRVELRSGAVRAAYSVEADNAFALVDRATAQFGSTGAGRADTLRLADATTSSLVAFRFYTEGLRAYYQGDAHSAHRLFRAALVEDSTFAMAAYYSWLSLESLGLATTHRELVRAVRLADRATDRERLLIRTAWADLMDEPARLPLAETLAIRYPTEPDGEYLLGRARLWGGDFLGALPHLRRVVAMDSLSLRGVQPRCRACDALAEAVFAYSMADSFPAAERTAREWTRLQPGSARSWSALARVLEFQDRYGEALAARRTASPLQPGNRIDPI
ncbi:MAG: BTAD domain-containing putative transcriptional regulator [Longimicrobiaceae bacterium]